VRKLSPYEIEAVLYSIHSEISEIETNCRPRSISCEALLATRPQARMPVDDDEAMTRALGEVFRRQGQK
jgi:hypothetical protein